MSEFTCEKCKKTYISKNTEKMRMDEYLKSAWYIPEDQKAVVCDDCYLQFKAWFDTLTEEDHKRIRAEVIG